MLELSQEQLRQLQQQEQQGFVYRVRQALVSEFPDVESPALQARLERAHEHALRFGLASAEARTQFLYQEAFAPGFYEQAPIRHWLTLPGAEPEQRWRDFQALAFKRVEER